MTDQERPDLWTWPADIVQEGPLIRTAHDMNGTDCWCRPYPDPEDPRIIVHRKEGRA